MLGIAATRDDKETENRGSVNQKHFAMKRGACQSATSKATVSCQYAKMNIRDDEGEEDESTTAAAAAAAARSAGHRLCQARANNLY